MEVNIKYSEWVDFSGRSHEECIVTTIVGGQMTQFSRFGDTRKEALGKAIGDMERMQEDLYQAISIAKAARE